jgi:NAD(P)-dependent dehydrogenase (short-subunit alcohol dehydrogenase family)
VSSRSDFSLAGKVAVVTGASSGIGTAIAHAYSNAGARVVLVGRDVERLRLCGDECAEHHLVVEDLAADDAPGQVVSETIGAFGSLDILVHSAGIFWPKPYGRVGVVEDIAPVAVFLASDAARYIHGESILVDGGWAAQ